MDALPKELVHIRWHDAMGCHSNWQRLEHLDDNPLRDNIIDSVGFIIRETDTVLHLAPHLQVNGNEGHYCGDMEIPKAMIVDEWGIE